MGYKPDTDKLNGAINLILISLMGEEHTLSLWEDSSLLRFPP